MDLKEHDNVDDIDNKIVTKGDKHEMQSLPEDGPEEESAQLSEDDEDEDEEEGDDVDEDSQADDGPGENQYEQDGFMVNEVCIFCIFFFSLFFSSPFPLFVPTHTHTHTKC